MNVLIVNSSYAYDVLFTKLGHDIIHDISKAELVVFTGGADVSPNIYGDAKHPMTGNDVRRDAAESLAYNDCIVRGTPMVGICRGGQFLNVMNGGRMYQHVDKHCGNHEITDLMTGETVLVSSTHHQMMMPAENGLLVASSGLRGSREWYDGEIFRKDVSEEDIEVVFYEETQSLCFQPHPEFSGAVYDGMFEYFNSLLGRFIYAEEVA